MIEMIVVIGVIAMLASMAMPLAGVMEDRARGRATLAEMEGIESALQSWYEDFAAFPADLDSLAVNGYLTADPDPTGHSTDAWFTPYSYTVAGMSASIVSSGVDLTAGTADDVTLLVSASPRAREETRDEIRTIHVALRNYETLRIPNALAALPAHWEDVGAVDGAFQMLIDESLIPDEVRFLTDSWGAIYNYTGTPADYVTSVSLGP